MTRKLVEQAPPNSEDSSDDAPEKGKVDIIAGKTPKTKPPAKENHKKESKKDKKRKRDKAKKEKKKHGSGKTPPGKCRPQAHELHSRSLLADDLSMSCQRCYLMCGWALSLQMNSNITFSPCATG